MSNKDRKLHESALEAEKTRRIYGPMTITWPKGQTLAAANLGSPPPDLGPATQRRILSSLTQQSSEAVKRP